MSPKETEDFEAFADDSEDTVNFMRANTLYIIDVSKQPRREMVDSDFQRGRKVPRYWIKIVEENGELAEVAVSGNVYKNIVAFKRRLVEMAVKHPELLLIGYAKPKSNFVANR